MRKPIAPIVAASVLALGGCQYFKTSTALDPIRYQPVFDAARACQTATVQAAVEREPILLKGTEMNGVTLLLNALSGRCPDLALYLIGQGADPNAKMTGGLRPLHFAAKEGMLPAAKALVARHAKVDAKADNGKTPLDFAIEERHAEVAAYLQDAASGQR